MDSQITAILGSEARRLAAQGDYEAALDLVNRIPRADGAALRARIYCQRGRFNEGVECWREAVAADPGNEDAKRGLALAESLARSPIGAFRLNARRWMLAGVVLVAASLAVWRVVTPGGAPSNRELVDLLVKLGHQVEAGNMSSRESMDALGQRLVNAQIALSTTTESQEQIRGQLQRVQQSLRRVEKTLAEQPRR